MDPDLSRETVGDLIRSRRVRKGITQRQLADLSTVSVRTIRDLEAGRTYRPRPHTVSLILSALGLGHGVGEVAAQSSPESGSGTGEGHLLLYESPPPAAGLTGRDDDILAICELVPTAGHRLVTVTGLAGVGKTQVAIGAADLLRTASGFRVVWVPVGQEPSTTRAQGVIREGPHSTAGGLTNGVENGLAGDVPTLVLFDGLGYDRRQAGRIRSVLRRYPHVCVLVTARAPLGIAGEQVVPLAPLPAPDQIVDLGSLSRSPAVRLLVASARRARPTFALADSNAAAVGDLVRRVDGIPSLLNGIGWALQLVEPDQLLDWLTTDPVALYTEVAPELVDALQHAVSMLEPGETVLLRRMARLSTAWSVDEAAKISDLPRTSCVRYVRRLLETGLVRIAGEAAPVRFQALELVKALTAAEAGPEPST